MAEYPLPKFHFEAEWGGVRIGANEITGLEVETQVIEYRDCASPEYSMQKIPGMQKYSNVTMKRAVFASDNDYFAWWNTVALNTVEKRNVTISLLNEAHEPVVVWKIKNAWPAKITSTDLKSDGNELAIEAIELAHDGLTIQND